MNLKALILNNNQITYIENLPIHLDVLILSNNQIGEITNVEKLKELNKLNLSHNSIRVANYYISIH